MYVEVMITAAGERKKWENMNSVFDCCLRQIPPPPGALETIITSTRKVKRINK